MSGVVKSVGDEVWIRGVVTDVLEPELSVAPECFEFRYQVRFEHSAVMVAGVSHAMLLPFTVEQLRFDGPGSLGG